MDNVIQWFVKNVAARLVMKWLTLAAGAMVTHGLMAQDKSSAWINSNAEVVIGIIGVALSHAWTYWHDKQSKAPAAPTVTTPAPTTNFTAGTSPNVLPLILGAMLVSSAAFADTNWLDNVGKRVSFGGVFTVSPQQSPAQGPAVQWAAWQPVVKDVQLSIGPAYVIGTTGQGTVHHYLEASCILKLADTPYVKTVTENIPFVRRAALFIGIGSRADNNVNVAGSFGATFSF